MTSKEALQLNAIDANKIAYAENLKNEESADSGADKKKEKYLKATDYEKCMEYHGSN